MTQKNVYEIITDHMIARLEKGVVPWKLPWNPEIGAPRNIRGNHYRGVNQLMLQLVAWEMEYSDNVWLTFSQAKEMKAKVKKGEVSTPVIFWKVMDVPKPLSAAPDEKTEKFFLLRYYRVFNVDQIEGLPEGKLPEKLPRTLASGEDIVSGYPNPPTIMKNGVKASYIPQYDTIRVPVPWAFTSTEEYYSTLFHEMVHSTGHEKRLNRNLQVEDLESYSKEELVAELGAAFLCAEAGILPKTIDNSAAYLAGWLKALKDDPKLIINASSSAQKAVEHILHRAKDEDIDEDEDLKNIRIGGL